MKEKYCTSDIVLYIDWGCSDRHLTKLYLKKKEVRVN